LDRAFGLSEFTIYRIVTCRFSERRLPYDTVDTKHAFRHPLAKEIKMVLSCAKVGGQGRFATKVAWASSTFEVP
jgi:hypothetical protein